MTFHATSIRLAGLYLTVMMAISIFFSTTVYQLSLQELDRGLRKPVINLTLPQGKLLPDTVRQQLADAYGRQYQEAKSRVLTRLILINLVILLGGGVLCYYLARRTLQPIEEAHAAQNRFTADASHELRTPIAVMRSEIEVALMNPKLTLAHAKEKLQSNLEELGKLTKLSDGLLRLAQLDHSNVLRNEVKLDVIVQQAVTRVLPAAEAKHIPIEITDSAQAVAIGDHDSLVEALVTILDNAVKYSPPKTSIAVQPGHAHGNATIRIVDQGIGIKATALPHIFDRFYRADAARDKQQVHGYGLGLAIAKDIIDAHHGTVSAESTVGKGTTITITLPLK
jgi:signal transduction histidine kinase